jgi:hypothetical protein
MAQVEIQIVRALRNVYDPEIPLISMIWAWFMRLMLKKMDW